MTIIGNIEPPDDLRLAIERTRHGDEAIIIDGLVEEANFRPDARRRIDALATRLVVEVRRRRIGHGGLDAFLQEYELSNQEGVVLMCLAEALLRIPDAVTADRLIRDKIGDADWAAHLGQSDSLFVNASTWALMLTGRVVRLDEAADDVAGFLGRLVARSGEPVIRQAMVQAMRIMGRQFVMGRTIDEALSRAREGEANGYCHSYDMLGEAACTAADAAHYLNAYASAIDAVGRAGGGDVVAGPGISVKLSALHPRYEAAQRGRVLAELVPRLLFLAKRAKDVGIGLCVDAEEVDRLDLSLDVIEAVSADPATAGWDGFGVALQAYQKCALPLVDWFADMARRHRRRLMLRLVKGACWDSEIKRSQELGLATYPVFTRKSSTDVAYLACARRILASPNEFYPQFATHNAHTLAAIIELADDQATFEFQRLHGMGEALYDQVVGGAGLDHPCRIYAPVGGHDELLAYLVRRLLENGANSSFVNRIVDAELPVVQVVADPIGKVAAFKSKAHPKIALPPDLYGGARKNARGLDLADSSDLRSLSMATKTAPSDWSAGPVIGGEMRLDGTRRSVFDPANRRRQVGAVVDAAPGHVDEALKRARAAAPAWDEAGAAERAACLERAADLFEDNRAELLVLCVRESGKTVVDAIAEIREAIDFCRYYSGRARADFAEPLVLPGPTGELNQVALHGRGVFACISPWNFPFAIFVGQVSAALAAGNAVVAKPAEQTPLIAARAVQFLQQAGVPGDVLHLLPGDGPGVGAPLVADGRTDGVAFTGSVDTAQSINRLLADRSGAIVPLIAETGGQNAMIVDSSALPEQVVADVITSAFRSAGQRCSALRVLFLQRDIADRMIDMLTGEMAELVVGDPGLIETDVGPVIDDEAQAMLEGHAARMEREAKILFTGTLDETCNGGTYSAPRAYLIDSLDRLDGEVFGPILHVLTYDANRLDEVVDAIARTGYGLTFGVHTRVDTTAGDLHARLRVGNTYVNRNIIGAIVGVQPFGGEGLSGTGPKAGGPRYLYRFATERTLSVNTAAAGGNAALMSLEDDADE